MTDGITQGIADNTVKGLRVRLEVKDALIAQLRADLTAKDEKTRKLRGAIHKLAERGERLKADVKLWGLQDEQKHLDEGTIERLYWHYGYAMACFDAEKLLAALVREE